MPGMYLRTSLGESAPPARQRHAPGRRTTRRRSPESLVLISGGPGLHDARDLQHDQSWANYVTPPLLLSRRARAFAASAERRVSWLVYRPAYERRWADDLRRARTSSAALQEVRRIRGLGFDSYTDLVEHRARERNWRLLWFDSAEGFYTALGAVPGPVSRLWFWGHARNDLWMYVEHSQGVPGMRDGTAVSPPSDAVVTVGSISAHAALKPKFLEGGTHCFVGCSTMAFAQEWSRVFGVVANGTSGTINFGRLSLTGGVPDLAPGVGWCRFSPPVRQPAP
ncbi:hypothetical protein [Streptomyces sp. NBC_01236]|uniref:hypothetical protein n=1 Tax=Streptomyces sp. NBC_01236 TaxID=2903789 RepID=UPI002E124CED|nr:hypothetical protein OG324_42865 [Streptomyces sp. NBC_01236]